MTATGLPFDDIRNLLRELPPVDEDAAGRVRASLRTGGGEGRLGRLPDLAAWYSAATGRAPGLVARPSVALFAGTHGVSARLGIDRPAASLLELVEEIASGAAPVSQLCGANDLGLDVFDLALEVPVGDITIEAALEERDCAATIAFGMEAVASGADLLCLGTVGAQADVSALALLRALRTGADGAAEAAPEETALAEEALAAHAGYLGEPLEALRRLGGREISALAGAILAARTQKVAVVLDGLPALAAAAVLRGLNPAALDHCLLADSGFSNEGGFEALLPPPVCHSGTRDPAGLVLAAGMIKSACKVASGAAEVAQRQTAAS
ncbi:nicotinate-nucleotide--dimethylbenzimidazole phosphoribosyltransferase [Nitratireductor thuwali]|uniref:Nicotinate-nucleotide--dimethylbenzimidazole phosphoribosyltransferase n=1 Tax=Nitratireductor thuwali TaxID=2267699 RepID=A0ABY5MI96_9HYPH|nr:Nicotinate-nucleotide--dimethylbenzimidazole phosphoribosyltransferase [Nitratireductor thuwali]